VTLNLDFKVTIDAFDVLCAQLTRDLFAIAKSSRLGLGTYISAAV